MFTRLPHEGAHWATCSLSSLDRTNWASVLAYQLDCDPVADNVNLPALPDQMVMLVTAGSTTIESRAGGKWRRSVYGPGTVAMTPPGQATHLRWRGTDRIRTIQVYLPGPVTDQVALEMYGQDSAGVSRPHALATEDPLIAQILRALISGVHSDGANELYAESAATFLSAHLLARHAGRPPAAAPPRADRRIATVMSYMRENLDQPISLGDMAAAAGLSPFHFLRVFKAATGQTPRRSLSAMRLRCARRYLERTDLSVTEISEACGFATPSQLATSFRQEYGMSPTDFRRRRP